jgi:hypothetical protein
VQWDKPVENLNQLLLPTDPSVVHADKRINKYKKRFYVKTQNLLTGETAQSEEEIEVTVVLSPMHVNAISLEFNKFIICGIYRKRS